MCDKQFHVLKCFVLRRALFLSPATRKYLLHAYVEFNGYLFIKKKR